jgi:hypothetical protein
MKIKYTNILDDHINFSKHHRGESKTSKELVIWTLILCSLLFIYGKMSEFQYLSYIIIGLLLFVLLIVLSPYFWNKLIHKESAKLFEDKENKGFFCEHELVIDELGLNEITEVGNQYVKWSGISKIDETDDYLYIYVGSLSAHVIPKKRVEGNLDEFIKLLNQNINISLDQ